MDIGWLKLLKPGYRESENVWGRFDGGNYKEKKTEK